MPQAMRKGQQDTPRRHVPTNTHRSLPLQRQKTLQSQTQQCGK